MPKVVLITGASRGIGREVANKLAKDGYKVIANYNKSEKEALKLKEENENIDIFKADVSKRDECQKLVEYTINNYEKIDILINNAGISKVGLFTDLKDNEWEEIIQTNLYSAFYMSQEVLKNMIKEKNGCIINISSIWGIVGASCEVAYSISKAGINGMTKALAKEVGPSNIRVNAIAPGMIETEMISDLTEEDKKEIIEETPLRKIGKPADIYKTVKYLIEDEYTTGQIISPNGGWIIT